MSETKPGDVDRGAFDRLHQLGGRELVETIIQSFLVDGPKYAAAIDPEAEDLTASRRAAHMLKTSAAYVGAEHLRALAERAEHEAESGDRRALTDTGAAIDAEIAVVRPELTAASKET